eukprot:scaffold356086_cov10-Prasinocladus_malaysianus.AAC.1
MSYSCLYTILSLAYRYRPDRPYLCQMPGRQTAQVRVGRTRQFQTRTWASTVPGMSQRPDK